MGGAVFTAAAGNTLTEIRIYIDGTYLFWNVSGSPSVIQPRTFPALAPACT